LNRIQILSQANFIELTVIFWPLPAPLNECQPSARNPAAYYDEADVKTIKERKTRKTENKTPRDIIGAENIAALNQAGFVVVRVSELSKLRANIKSVFDTLSKEPPRNHGA
jgi:hypothetical protein